MTESPMVSVPRTIGERPDLPPARIKPGDILKLIPMAMAKLPAVGKWGRNDHDRYDYRQVQDFYSAVGPIFGEVGITVHIYELSIVSTGPWQTKGGGNWVHLVVMLRARYWAPDGSWIEHQVYGEATDGSDKVYSKAQSSAMKTLLEKSLLIPMDLPEPDRESPPGEPAKAQRPKSSPPKQQAKVPPKEEPAAVAAGIVDMAAHAETEELVDKLEPMLAAEKGGLSVRDYEWAAKHLQKRRTAIFHGLITAAALADLDAFATLVADRLERGRINQAQAKWLGEQIEKHRAGADQVETGEVTE